MKNLKKFRRYFDGYAGLSAEFAEFLRVFPLANGCNIGRLAELGTDVWTPTESVVMIPDPVPMEASIIDILHDVHKYPDKVIFDGANVKIVLDDGNEMHIAGSMWIGGYLGILAWHELHPLVLAPSSLTGLDRIDEIIAEIPYVFAGLNLAELVQLTDEHGWNQKVGDAPEGTMIGEVEMTRCLYSCTHRFCTFGQEYVIFSQRTLRGYKLLDPRWLPVIEALQQRLANLEGKVPGQPSD